MNPRIRRLSFVAQVLAAALAILPQSVRGQTPTTEPSTRWSLHIATGSMMPVGGLHDALRSAPLTAVQVSRRPSPRLALIATLGWARSRDLIAVGSPKVDAFTADVGAEWRGAPRALARWSSVAGFAGGGVGMRRYDSRAVNTDASHHLTSYAALGGDVTLKRVGLRVEMRDYLGGFTPIGGTGTQKLANDVVLMTTLRFLRRSTAAR